MASKRRLRRRACKHGAKIVYDGDMARAKHDARQMAMRRRCICQVFTCPECGHIHTGRFVSGSYAPGKVWARFDHTGRDITNG